MVVITIVQAYKNDNAVKFTAPTELLENGTTHRKVCNAGTIIELTSARETYDKLYLYHQRMRYCNNVLGLDTYNDPEFGRLVHYTQYGIYPIVHTFWKEIV